MALGFMQALLLQSRSVFMGATPSKKLTPAGYLKYLLANDKPQILSAGIADGSGHIRDVKYKYRVRVPAGKTSTVDDCSIDARPVYKEQTVNLTKFRKYSMVIDDATIARYEKEASAISGFGTIGAPATEFMQDTFNAILESMNGFFADINNDLLTTQAANFGENQTNHLTTAKTVNFPLATTQNDLNTGMTMLMNDAMLNEINMENLTAVGSGLINNYMLQNRAKEGDASGLNTSKLGLPAFYFDPYAAVKWGTNQFGLFEKNAVQLLNINRFAGFRGGDKMVTKLGTIKIPIVDSLGDTGLSAFSFDYQWEYNKCPSGATTIGGESYGSGSNLTALDRGWILTLMATYDQVNIPSDAYDAADRLVRNNGTLRYSATNS